MSAPKTKPAANGTKTSQGPITRTDSSASAPSMPVKATHSTSGKPDRAAYDAEQQRIKAEIDLLQEKLTDVKDKISLATKGGSGNEKRNALRAQLDDLRSQQSGNKSSRSKIFDQMKALQEGIQKKVKDLQASRDKVRFRTVEDVDTHIRHVFFIPLLSET